MQQHTQGHEPAGPQGKKVSIGRIVHYFTADGVQVAAIVTRVHGNQVVDLTVFRVGAMEHVYSARQQSHAGDLGVWQWPELL